MRYGVAPESLGERMALALGRVPTPLADTLVAIWLARALMVAARLGVFQALADGPLPAAAVAARTDGDPRAVGKLLDALVGARYLCLEGNRYALSRTARRWLLPNRRRSLHDSLLARFLDWELTEHFETFVRTGRPTRFHETMSPEQWRLYQRGMRSLAGLAAPEAARRMPVPRGARAMLDVGGGHGYFAAELCRKYPTLRATVLDLPAAIDQAAELLSLEGLGERIVHRAGDARTAELGEGVYDLVLIANLAHHFDEPTNRDLVGRAARALRPAGCLVLHDLIRPRTPHDTDQVGALANLYFAATSRSGTWSFPELASWLAAAGLDVRRPVRLRSVPGFGQVAGIKSQ